MPIVRQDLRILILRVLAAVLLAATASSTLAETPAVLSVTSVVSAQTPEPPLLPYVASVKVNVSGDEASFTRRLPGGTFLASNMTLRNVIAFAHGVQPFQIEGGPDWMSDVRFDITIKAEANVGPTAIGPTQIGLQLARAVLVERFSFKAHRETRERSVLRWCVRVGTACSDHVSSRVRAIASRSPATLVPLARPGRRAPPRAAFCADCSCRERA